MRAAPPADGGRRMNPDRLDALITRWSDGSLSPEEAHELETLLLADPEARRLFRRHANLDAGLRDWPGQGRTPWVAQRVVARRRSHWTIPLSAAALLLFGVAYYWPMARNAPISA